LSEQREPERYAELFLLLDGAAAARSVLESMLEDGVETADVSDVEAALCPLQEMGRVPPGGAVVASAGVPPQALSRHDAEAALQEFRAGTVIVDFSGEDHDDLDRVIGARLFLELEDPDEPGAELVRFGEAEELVTYNAEWAIATVPGGGGLLARLDLEFNRPHRFSLRLLFDVASHQWALRAMELTGNCVVSVRMGNEQRRVSVRAPRSAQLMSALTVVRMLDGMANFLDESDLEPVGLDLELESPFRAQAAPDD
jgi:hypothetical protein